jgi:hypothetical protein
MIKRIIGSLGIAAVLLAVPAIAGASVAFTKIVAPYTFASQPSNPAIYVANNDGSGVRKLSATGTWPEISPDGTTIAYLKDVKVKKSDSTTIDTYYLHFLTIATNVDFNTKLQCQSLAWAPNSSAVACNLEPTMSILSGTGGTGLVTVTPSGKVTTISEDTDTVSVAWNSATWSPDSSMIAWESNVSSSKVTNGFSAPKLRAKNADGTGPLIKLGNNAATAVWGPNLIAYQAFTGSGDSLTSQVWTVNPKIHNSSTATQVTHWTQPKNGMDSGPSPSLWTPNGKTIIGVIAGMDDDATSVKINATTGKITPISVNNQYSNSPMALSSDGSTVLIYYYSQACCSTKAVGYVVTASLTGTAGTLFKDNVSFMSVSADWKP